ncbi:ferritin [Striga asiatica]|uniref:Ferritin n=1 Tax=Striga asiatica TaxID=4170 RepID=A0A5A7Q1J8_STRAF|nr:ferritin [Striga asiatica]
MDSLSDWHGFQKELSDVLKSCFDIFLLTENRAFSILQKTAPAPGNPGQAQDLSSDTKTVNHLFFDLVGRGDAESSQRMANEKSVHPYFSSSFVCTTSTSPAPAGRLFFLKPGTKRLNRSPEELGNQPTTKKRLLETKKVGLLVPFPIRLKLEFVKCSTSRCKRKDKRRFYSDQLSSIGIKVYPNYLPTTLPNRQRKAFFFLRDSKGLRRIGQRLLLRQQRSSKQREERLKRTNQRLDIIDLPPIKNFDFREWYFGCSLLKKTPDPFMGLLTKPFRVPYLQIKIWCGKTKIDMNGRCLWNFFFSVSKGHSLLGDSPKLEN